MNDMVSNVVDYIADCYQDSYNNAHNTSETLIDDVCEYRVTRGGIGIRFQRAKEDKQMKHLRL